MMILGRCESISRTRPGRFDAISHPPSFRGAERSNVDTNRIDTLLNRPTDMTNLFSPVTDCNSDRIFSLPGLNKHRGFDRTTVNLNLYLFVLLGPQRLCCFRINNRGVIPSHFGNRIRNFLDPSIVRQATIMQSRRRKHHLDRIVLGHPCRSIQTCRNHRLRNSRRTRSRALHEPVMNRFKPVRLSKVTKRSTDQLHSSL